MISWVGHVKIHLIKLSVDQLLLTLKCAFLVDFLLDLSKLDVALDNVDVGGSHQSANFSHVVGSDLEVTVSSSHCFTESDQALKLSDCDLVSRSLRLILLILSQSLKLFLEHECRFLGEFGFDCATELNVCLELLCGEIRSQSVLSQAMHVDNVISNVVILIISFLIEDHEEEIETGHDWS